MKKLIFTMFLVVMAAFLLYGTAGAVSGPCSDCHTMHNSQNGQTVATGGPNDLLLKSSTCLGCHTGTGAVGPRIENPALLSAGSFADSFVASSTMTHNVEDLTGYTAGNKDLAMLTTNNYTPPGWGGTSAWTVQLKCAGTNGCHGSHDAKTTSWDGIQGYHHSTGTYKFLEIAQDNSGAGTPVVGQASSDYEAGGATATNHNIYTTGATGISKFCANCHEDFHGVPSTNQDTTGNGLWNRHPTDLQINGNLPTAGISVDYANTPFAFTSAYATGLSTTSATGYDVANGYVMCLSCHRAHASEYNDLLRFNYASQLAGGGGTTGCLNCHTSQR
jgi:nitrate/TMAO reductase-like tetraheme cytochrome c subunit